MDATMRASRAVLAAYAKKALRPAEITAVGVFVVALAGAAYLIAAVSPWWWLLMGVVIAYGVVGSVVWLMLHFTIDKLDPEQTNVQAEAVAEFIAQTEKVADTIGLSRFGLLLRILQGVMNRKKDNVVTEFAFNSQELQKKFERVVASFRS